MRIVCLAATLLTSASVLSATIAAAAGDTASRIPLAVGLTTVLSVADVQGDYESIEQIKEVGPKGYRETNSAELPGTDGQGARKIMVSRFVQIEDLRNARVMHYTYWSRDPEVFPGTTPGVSAAIVNELRAKGAAAMTFVDVRLKNGLPIERKLEGSVSRIGVGSESFSILVNGHRTELRVLHAKGRLGDARGAQDLEFHVLDDPENPLMLAVNTLGLSSRMTRIEFPQAAGSADSIERALEANRASDVYGIYFDFGSAVLRPESDRVLKELAELMGRHRDWKLQIDGHTDNIGGNPANLDLSRRRAAAVKAALVQRFAIASARLSTGGFGAGRPKDTNDTVEGRALNRRVELRRL
jgi:OOP family OmpA-OmpF porin